MRHKRLYKKKDTVQRIKREEKLERKKERRVLCPYCITKAVLVAGDVIYPHRPDLHSQNFWYCRDCNAYVGCHKENPSMGYDGTEPLGKLANRELRLARMRAHHAFDPVWKEGKNTRSFAYLWLADHMDLTVSECHIGMMNIEQCAKVMELVAEHYG